MNDYRDIPDAPWVRDAERNGMPSEDDDFACPVCGAVTPDYIYRSGQDVVGCCECIERIEGWEYAAKQEERKSDDA